MAIFFATPFNVADGPGRDRLAVAMAWLKQAVAAGYKDGVHIQKDKDVEALCGREDFKRLLAELNGAKAEKK